MTIKNAFELDCVATRMPIGFRKKVQYSLARWLVVVTSTTLLLIAPSPAHSSPITLLVKGAALLADFGGAASTLHAIFGGDALANDDHPLYSTATSSPTLTISATLTTFDLLLQQPNDVSVFEDDFSAVLSGIAQVAIPGGNADVWGWSITIEADMLGPRTIKWGAQGFVQHLFAPHLALNEAPKAPALGYDLTVNKNCGFIFCTWVNDPAPGAPHGSRAVEFAFQTGSVVHHDGPHFDQLTEALLQVKCCTTNLLGFFIADSFNVHLQAIHTPTPVVPEPATLALLGLGLAGLRISRRHQRTLSS